MDFTLNLVNRGNHSTWPCWWNYEFPNGQSANVWLSATPFRFDMEVDNPDAENGLNVFTDLSTAEVEARLTEFAGRPAQVTA